MLNSVLFSENISYPGQIEDLLIFIAFDRHNEVLDLPLRARNLLGLTVLLSDIDSS